MISRFSKSTSETLAFTSISLATLNDSPLLLTQIQQNLRSLFDNYYLQII